MPVLDQLQFADEDGLSHHPPYTLTHKRRKGDEKERDDPFVPEAPALVRSALLELQGPSRGTINPIHPYAESGILSCL